MWLLLLIFLNADAGTRSTTVLEEYGTRRACEGERTRIWLEMVAAYPDSHDMFFVCQLKEAV